MKKWPIALQVFSIRNEAQADFAATMQKVKDMGYDGVEIAGISGLTVPQIKQVLDQVGLRFVSAHEMMEGMEQEGVLESYAAIGMEYLTIPGMDMPKTPAEQDQIAVRMTKLAERCRQLGMQLLYHNHEWEFKRIEGEYIYDGIFSRTDPKLLQCEMDVCWLNMGGEDPIDYLGKYTGRVPIVHAKDCIGRIGPMLYGEEDGKTVQLSPTEEGGTFDYRPVGHGEMDMPGIIAAAEKAGSQWLIVEQDEPCLGKTPLECAQLSIRYLKTLLEG